MQFVVVSSLLAFALFLAAACLVIGNKWIGLALLVLAGMFAYSQIVYLRRVGMRMRQWWHRQHLRMIDSALVKSYAAKRDAEYDRDYVAADAEVDFIDRLHQQRRVCIARLQRIDFEMSH